jgi:hypothetical protein
MKKINYLVFFLLLSCATSKVMTDYDTEINFSNFKSYDFFEDVGKGLNEFDVKRVITSINLEMNQLGFEITESPDFYINVISKMSAVQNNNTIGIGIGNGGFGVSGGIPIGRKKRNEEFTIEFVNSKTDETIWEGLLNSKIKEKRNPEEKELHFKEIIKKILANYPPKKETKK